MNALLRVVTALSPAACLALVLATLLGVQTLRLAHTRTALAQERATRAIEAAQATTAARAEEQRRTIAQQEIAHAAQQAQAHAAADRRAADAAAGSLRQRFAALAATCRAAPGDPAAAAAGPPAPTPADLLADVQRRLDDAAGQLAAAADDARIAGLACERSYDALTAK